MIRLGLFNTPIINGHGFIWMNEGGTVIFHGKACFGAGSVLKIAGSNALLEIGDDFNNASSGRIDCSYNINIKERVRLGWGTIIMDSSMHRLKDVNGRWAGKGYASIEIGENSWISSQCLVLPGTKFPSYSICAIGSILNKDYSQGEKGLYAGRPATFKKAGIWRDIYDDQIVYEKE